MNKKIILGIIIVIILIGGLYLYGELTYKTDQNMPGPQSSITILSPNGGENWNKGERKIIEYRIDGALPAQGSKVVLYLDGKDEIGSVNSNVSNSFTWTVGCYAGGDACSIKTGQHKIQARLYDGQQLVAQDESDGFFDSLIKYSQPITN